MSIQLPEIPEPVNPPAGQWEFFIDNADQQLKLKDSAGVVINLTSLNVSVFGAEFQTVKDESITTTVSDTFTTKLRLTTTDLPAGSYHIGWNYQWNYNQGTTDFVGQVSLDSGAKLLMEHRQEPKDVGGSGPGGSNQRHQLSGYAIETLTAGVHTIDIDYAAGVAGQIAAIWNSRLVLWRVS